jgi:hypothetical protein
MPEVANDMNTVAQRFESFAKYECAGYSPLYVCLAKAVAADLEILALAAHSPKGQLPPNLFFGAVQFLLLKGENGDLAPFYPSLTATPRSPEGAYPAFRRFCLKHAESIRTILATRRVQTNEVGRCAFLFPGFAWISKEENGQPVALIEIGTSAGLNLNWDRYAYRYDEETIRGDPHSSVTITCQIRGDRLPPLPSVMPRISSSVGVDLCVVNVNIEDQALWLRSLVWPEHIERAQNLNAAVELAKRYPPRLLEGDGISLLPALVDEISADIPLCVFHTAVIGQLSPEDRTHLGELFDRYGKVRKLYHLSAEGRSIEFDLGLKKWASGQRDYTVLAHCHAHGRWLEWLV